MTTRDKIIEQLNDRQQTLDNQREMVEALSEPLAKLDIDGSLVGTDGFDFDNLTHAEVIEVIRAFGGKWEKTPNEAATIDYKTTYNGHVVRCWRGAPPPNCKIVEEEVLMPPQPAYKAIRRRLVCTEAVKAEELAEPMEALNGAGA